MTKHIDVPINVFRVVVALQMALGGVLLLLLMLRWPLVGGVALAVSVCVVAWVGIVHVVTSGAQPLPAPARDASATVDGVPVRDVEVMQP